MDERQQFASMSVAHRVPLRWVRRSLKATGNRLRITQRSIRRQTSRRGESSPVSTAAVASAMSADAFTRPFFTVAAEGMAKTLESGMATMSQAMSALMSAVNKDDDDACELSARGFPARFTPIHSAAADRSRTAAMVDSQELTATGCKHWGSMWDGRGLLRIKIYDFAIYANPNQLQQAVAPPGVRKLSRWNRRRAPRIDNVVPNHDVEMSLTVRPARDLPLDVMAAEYDRILRKRMVMNGGDPEDAALTTLIRYFDPKQLPAGSTNAKGQIKRNATLNFCRSRAGTLTAVADGAVLATVTSPKLCEAVFDLYLGDNPVCKKAKLTSSRTMTEMLSQPLALKV